ncbi:unnamed protein product [Dicrocoelium dendriticum]|nr:unnamed protein product [Dicrocoelium dendriticum]
MDFCTRLDSAVRWRHQRWIILVAGLIEMIWFSGYHYGYNSLLGGWKSIGVFADHCVNFTSGCDQQSKMFEYGFLVWLITQMILITVSGIIMDRLGLRVLKLIAVGLNTIGTLMFAFITAGASVLYFLGGVFVALGCISSLICNHQISSMFPKYRGLVVSLVSGAFDSSTLFSFLVSKTYLSITMLTSFVILACCGAFYGTLMALFGLTQWSTGMENKGKRKDLMPNGNTCSEIYRVANVKVDQTREEEVNTYIQNILSKRYPNLRSCLLSLPFFLLVFWFMFGNLEFAFFLTRLAKQLNYLFDGDKHTVSELLDVSGAMLLGGFVVAPLSGFILDSSRAYFNRKIEILLSDRTRRSSDDIIYWTHLRGIATGFFIMAVSALVFSILNFIKLKALYYVTFVFFVIVRSLLFSSAISFMLIAFPVQYFGTINGVCSTVGGIFGLIQYGLIQFSPVVCNGIGLGIAIVLFATPVTIFLKHR